MQKIARELFKIAAFWRDWGTRGEYSSRRFEGADGRKISRVYSKRVKITISSYEDEITIGEARKFSTTLTFGSF